MVAILKEKTFGAFLKEKRKEREITSLRMSEILGVSPGHYCDIERGRRSPSDRETLEKIISALSLTSTDRNTLYDLVGRTRSELPPDLPDYIMGNEVVRVALRMAKDKASADDWRYFMDRLENK